MPTQHPLIEIPNTEKRSLVSSIVEQEFSLYVGLPYSYHQKDQTFSVLYLLDANVTYSFIDLIRVFQAQRRVPEFVTVGIGYPVTHFLETDGLRQRDFTPSIDQGTLAHERASSNQSESPIMMAGAEKFLRFLREELKPFLAANYRVTTENGAVFGISYGGLFALYALFTEPDTFDKYLIGSPSIWWDESIILSYERDFADQNTDLKANIFMYAGAQEGKVNINNVLNLAETLERRAYPSLRLKTQIFDDEDHMSVSLAGFFRGLREIYR